MTFDKSFTLDQMMNDAEEQMMEVEERLTDINATLNNCLGGRSHMSMLGAVVVSVAWGVGFLYAYGYVNRYLSEQVGMLTLGVSLALVAFLIIGHFVHMKYYGSILKTQGRLTKLCNRLEMGQSALRGNLQTFLAQQNAQWELPLEAGSSIYQETDQIRTQLSGMETLRNGFIAKIKDFLYYATCIAWAAVGSYALFDLVASFGVLDFQRSTIRTIMIIATVISCIIEMVIANIMREVTDGEVGNVTLLSTAAGPVVFIVLVLLVALVIAAIKLVFYIAAVVIGFSCLVGSICGG